MVTQDLRVPAGFIAQRFGGLPRAFWIVFSGTIANRVGDMVVPFLVFFLGSRGITAAQTGTVVVALGVGGFAGPALGGFLADRIGRKPALLIGLVATPASLGLLFAAPSLPTLMAAAVLLGLTSKLFLPAANALIADSVTFEQRPKAFSLIHWAINIGTAVAAATAGFLAGRGFGLLFFIDAVTCLVFAGIVAFGIKGGARPVTNKTSSGYSVVLRDRLMLAVIALTLAATTVYSMTEFAIPLSIRLDGLPPTVFGLVAVVNAIGVIVLQPVLYTKLAAMGRTKVLAASYLLVGIGVAATGFAHTPLAYVAAALIWTSGEVAGGIVAGGIVADLAPEEARGRYQGAILWSWGVARLVGPAMATVLITTAGPAVLWWTCAALGIAGTFGALRLTSALATRTGRP